MRRHVHLCVISAASAFLAPVALSPRSAVRRCTSESADSRASLEKLVLKTSSRHAGEVRRSSGTARRRRAREKALVHVIGRTESTAEFAAAIGDLRHLRFSERGAAGREKLEEIDALVSRGESTDWSEASAAAEAMVTAHPAWPEALHQLALVDYRFGRYKRAAELCRKVLEAKPHHFGALTNLCLCYRMLEDDEALAFWSARALPIEPGRRQNWATRAIRALDLLDTCNH